MEARIEVDGLSWNRRERTGILAVRKVMIIRMWLGIEGMVS